LANDELPTRPHNRSAAIRFGIRAVSLRVRNDELDGGSAAGVHAR
jgi:hypothetical protein